MINSTPLPWSAKRVGSKDVSDMVQLSGGGIADMWQNQTDPKIKALSYSLMNAVALIKEKVDATKCYSDIDNLPEDILDYFAVEMRAMYYSQDFSIEKKREIIKNSLIWYTKAGTTSAVEEMITAIFGEGYVEEWYNFESAYGETDAEPYTFDIIAESELMDPLEYMEYINSIISRIKNVRSHLRYVMFLRKELTTVYAAVQPYSFAVVTIRNSFDAEHTTPVKPYVGTAAESYPTITVGNEYEAEHDTLASLAAATEAGNYPTITVHNIVSAEADPGVTAYAGNEAEAHQEVTIQ